MRFGKGRRKAGELKPEIQMTPMLDMIFQLLVFFILTFKPVMDEGQFEITMSPISRGSIAAAGAGPALNQSMAQAPLEIVLRATSDGRLASGGITMGERAFPDMARLQDELKLIVGDTAEDFNVIIAAEEGLQYQFVLLAVNAVSHAGIQNINFSTIGGGN